MNMLKKIVLVSIFMIVCSLHAKIELFGIYPNCYDYIFIGEATTEDGKQLLTFQDLKYKTVMQPVGGKLGNITIKSYDKKIKDIPSSSGDTVKAEVAYVTMQAPDGKELELIQNQPAYFPGYLGKFVAPETIEIQIARENSVINDGEHLCTVSLLSSNEIKLAYGDKVETYIPMNKTEQETLLKSISEKKKDNLAKTIKEYDEKNTPKKSATSQAFADYQKFIYDTSLSQSEQDPSDIQQINATRNDLRSEMLYGEGKVIEQKNNPYTKTSGTYSSKTTPKNDYDTYVEDTDYVEREKEEKQKIKKEKR
ncbi:MAG: hypothetical protein PF692_03100 [Kiritimatiellae bacterium]|jgi:hypothetical protein|nr:hypothetical protein [Kiritimatiellia bacterium]